jgi:hypothetical protein
MRSLCHEHGLAERPVNNPSHNPPAKEWAAISRGPRYSGLLMAMALSMAQPRGARAENSLSYEYEDYREMGGRISVGTDSALLEQDLGTDMHLKLGGVLDTIAGATPSGMPAQAGSDQVALTHESDRRHAWNTDLSRQFSAINVDLGFARSIEHDYMSNGWSANTLTDFNQKNTTLLLGASGTDDNVEVVFKPAWLRKVSNDAIIGITQLIDPLTSVSVNATWTRETGFLSDQYKVVEVNVQIFPGIFLPETFGENRPNARNKGDVFASVNRAFPAVDGALEASYRFYHDTWGITANTLDILWVQKAGVHFIFRPDLRLYHQSAAQFYTYNLENSGLRSTHNPGGPFYSSDARLSALDSVDFGLKSIWKVNDRIQFDAALEGYRQRGTDGVTPQSAYYRARVISFGSKLSW